MVNRLGPRLILVAFVVLIVACQPVRPATPEPTPASPVGRAIEPAGDEALSASDPVHEPGLEPETVYTNDVVYITETLTPGQGEGQVPEEGPFPVTEYVQNQVVLTGRLNDIEQVAQVAGLAVPGLQQAPGLPVIGPVAGDIFAVIYEFSTEANTARTAVTAIRGVAAQLGLPVFTDPNYVAGFNAASDGACANPMSGEASPMSGEASPFVLPDGTTLPAGTPTSVMVPYFWRQWAFGPSGPAQGGINLVANGQRRTNLPTGQGQSIYILDTSPFTQTGVYSFGLPAWFSPTLRLEVIHPVASTLTPTSVQLAPCAIADHGLFVAGLAYAVAPRSTLRLVRVLDGQGKGDSGGIFLALFDLTLAHDPRSVVNMSFGFVPVPPPPSAPTLANACDELAAALSTTVETLGNCQDIRAIFEAWQTALDSPTTAQNILDRIDMPMLALLIGELGSQGVVMAAAAGNKSHAGHALDPQLPAGFGPYLLQPTGTRPGLVAMVPAVAGNHQRRRAFYSNQGIVMAPGGGDNDPNCAQMPPSMGCWDTPGDFVISIIYRPQASPRFTFGLWAGTSFASPLVAGMEAVEFGSTVQNTVNAINSPMCQSNPPPPSVRHPHGLCF
jgi:hypothetical protein